MSFITDFIELSVPRQAQKALAPVLDRGWIGIHAHIAALPNDQDGMTELAMLVALERQTHRRDHVLHRLYRAFGKKRRDLEERRLYA